MTGTAGDFISSLPQTVTYALLISLLVSVFLVPMMSYIFIKNGIKGENSNGKKAAFLKWIQSFYDKMLEKSFKKKRTIVAIGAASFVIGLILLASTPQQNFPAFERNQFAVEVYLPVGTSLKQTDAVMKEVEDKLMKDIRVKEVAAFVGTSSPRFNSLYAPNFPAKHYGQLLVITESAEATKEILDEYSKTYSDSNPRAYFKWKQLEMSPSKSPIEVRISGDSISTLKRIAAKVADIARNVKGVQWVRTDYEQQLQSVRLNLKEDEAARLGYSKTILDYSLMFGSKGFPVSTLWENDYPVNVNLRVDKKNKSQVEDIMNQYVTSPFLVSSVPVRQLADIKQEWTEGQIVRRNGVRTLTVRVDVERGEYASDILGKLTPEISSLQIPKGTSISYGGEYEMGVDELTPLYYSLVISVAIIFIILLSQFRNSKTAILIMMTIPLCVFGAAFGVAVTGYPFSTTAFIGLIGLIGIIVRNGIIYVSYAEELRREHGHTLQEAAISSAKRRMRPIFLTSSAAAIGVVPMILSGSPLWGPLGAVICFGLLFGLVLSLLVIPVLYYLFHRKDFDKIENGEVA
jgi:multidrug efflux pump subunit AcrB